MRQELKFKHNVQFKLTLSIGLVASWSYLLEGASISCEAVSYWKIKITKVTYLRNQINVF